MANLRCQYVCKSMYKTLKDWHHRGNVVTDVNTDERKLEANLRISCFNNRRPRTKNDLTYLVRDVLFRYILYIYVLLLSVENNGTYLICKCVSPDHKQRSAGEIWPTWDHMSRGDFNDPSHYQRNAAFIPHYCLLPYQWKRSGLGLCRGRRQRFLLRLGELDW